jgi:hypothetical protein
MRRIVVISDLHIASGKLDDFDRELEAHFCSFLEVTCPRFLYQSKLEFTRRS